MNWSYIDSGPSTAARNMAIDEDLLAAAQAGETTPVLRFYTWAPPAVSLGRFQKIEEAVNTDACKRRGFDIVRRVTGGRAVLHNNELTYSIVARTDNPLFPPTVHETYKVIAAGLLAGLRNLGIDAEIVSRGGRHAKLVNKNSKDPACFSSPSWYEIVVNGKKLIGSAQKRLSSAFLQHGSILIDYDPALEAEVIPGGGAGCGVTCINNEAGKVVQLEQIKNAFRAGFSEALRVEFTTLNPEL
jgi:lipoate-protein ligase A